MSRGAAVIGDIHGESEQLERLLEKIGPDRDVYHVGDLIDRGPDSRGVIQICIDRGIQGVLGNHELWLHRFANMGVFDDMALSRIMGGKATLLSYKVTALYPDEIERQLKPRLSKAHREYILGLPTWGKFECEGQTYRLIHGGMKKADALAVLPDALREVEDNGDNPDEGSFLADAVCNVMASVRPASMLWTGPNMRSPNLHSFSDGSCQIFGHVPRPKPTVTKHWISIDTGCGTCPPHTLSAVLLPERTIVSAKGSN